MRYGAGLHLQGPISAQLTSLPDKMQRDALKVFMLGKRSAKTISLRERYVTDRKDMRIEMVVALKCHSRLRVDPHDHAVVAEGREGRLVYG